MRYICMPQTHLYTPVWKKREVLWEHVRRRGQEHCPLNNLNSFHCIIIKLSENVCWQNISAKFDNQPDPIKHLAVMALELSKFVKINLVCSVIWIFFNGSSSKFVTLFVGIISWPSSITSQTHGKIVEFYGPWISHCSN